jgi:DNA-directed RNA polymerase subunit RPC12/RpoP
METVDLIASGYEWSCPKCGELNREIEITENVKCSKCGGEFEVGEVNHAFE